MSSGNRTTESLLAAQVKKGQKHAFDQLFARYSQPLYRFSKSLLKNHEDAEGVVQEVRAKDQKFEEFVTKEAQVNYLDPEKEMTYTELKSLVEDAVEELPERRKQIYQFSRNEGMSHKEIAARLNIQAKTVENQLNLALKHIRGRLGNQTMAALLFAYLFI